MCCFFQVVNTVIGASTDYASLMTYAPRHNYCFRVAALTLQQQGVAWILVDKNGATTHIARGL